MPKLGTYGSVRGALSNGCLYRDCDIPKTQSLWLNPAWRPGHARAVLGCKHTRQRKCRTDESVGPRRAPQSPIA